MINKWLINRSNSRFVIFICFFHISVTKQINAQLFSIAKEKQTTAPASCTTQDIEKTMKQYYKDYGDAELTRCYKWHVNKSKEDVLKLFKGYAYKKGFSENQELYTGPLFYGRRPNGIQDVYNCFFYNGIESKRMGNTMAFANGYVFYKFWLDTAKHHIIPLAWNEPSAYIPPKMFGTQQGTSGEWRQKFIDACQNPDDLIMKNVYRMYFLYWQDYYVARRKMAEDAQKEVLEYTMKSLADAAYYDYYYGQNPKAGLKWNENVIQKNADSWAIDSLGAFIKHFPYSKHFNSYAAKFIEQQTTLSAIVASVLQFPTVSYNKQKVEATLLTLCNSLREIGLIRAMPGFAQLKQIEKKAYDLTKATKTIGEYETFLAYYPTGTYTPEIKKLRDAELKRIEDDRLSRLKAEGPGGLWFIKGPSLGRYLWVNTYRWDIVFLDKSTASFYCEFFPQVASISVAGQKIFEKEVSEPKAYFQIGYMLYLYKNIKYAAKAWYKITKNQDEIVEDGLIEVRDLTPLQKKDESHIYQITARKETDCSVFYSEGNKHIASISIDDGGLISSDVESDGYYSVVYDKDGKQVFKTSNPFDDNGFGSPSVSAYDLPATVVINYRKSKGSDTKFVTVVVKKTGSYIINIQ